MRKREYTDGHKNWLLQRMAMGASVAALAREYGVSECALRTWKKQAQEDARWEKMLVAANRVPSVHHRKEPPPREGVTVRPPCGSNPWTGHQVELCPADPQAEVLPPGAGAISGERDWKAEARLKMLEKKKTKKEA